MNVVSILRRQKSMMVDDAYEIAQIRFEIINIVVDRKQSDIPIGNSAK